MVSFKITIDCKPEQITASELQETLHEYFMMKLKSEGVAYKFGKIKVEEFKDDINKTKS